MSSISAGSNEAPQQRPGENAPRRSPSESPEGWAPTPPPGPSSSQHTQTARESASPRPSEAGSAQSSFRVRSRAVLLTWSTLREEPADGLVARFATFCRGRPNHWQTLAVVERHNPEAPGFDPSQPLHVHALTISRERREGWNTRNPRFRDFEGTHPNIAPKDLREGPGGCPARTAFHYLWKAVGELGESPDDLMAGELTEESLEGILVKGKGGKQSRMQADLEDGEEIVGAETKEEFYGRCKRLRPLQMTTAWNSVRAYAEHTYKEDTGLLPAIPIELPVLEVRNHVERADRWFEREVPHKAPGMRHRILVVEGSTGTGKTAYARSKGSHSRMCNVWNVGALLEDDDVWILDDMVHTNGRYSLKALSQYEADFTGRYKHIRAMKVRPTIILGNSRAAITKCWSDIEGEEGEAWVAGNVEWVYAGSNPFFVFP